MLVKCSFFFISFRIPWHSSYELFKFVEKRQNEFYFLLKKVAFVNLNRILRNFRFETANKMRKNYNVNCACVGNTRFWLYILTRLSWKIRYLRPRILFWKPLIRKWWKKFSTDYNFERILLPLFVIS